MEVRREPMFFDRAASGLHSERPQRHAVRIDLNMEGTRIMNNRDWNALLRSSCTSVQFRIMSEAIRTGNVTKIRALLSSGLVSRDVYNERDADGSTLLHHAALAGAANAVQALVKEGAMVNVLDGCGRLPADVASNRAVRRILESQVAR
jgi:ankyrin repeat protein